MLKLTLAIFVSWQLAVIIFQFSDAFRKRLGAWPFYLCGLLPTWRMFGPQPVDGDYQLYYRTAADKATFTPWQLLDYDKKPHPLRTLFFNPRAGLVKALREIAQEAAKAGSENNVYYQLLLNELIRELRRSGRGSKTSTSEPRTSEPPHRLVQFEIFWKTPSTLTPLSPAMSILTDIPSAPTTLLAIRWLLFLSMTIASIQNSINIRAYSSRGLLAWPFLKYAYQYPFFEAPAFNTLFGRTGFLLLNLVRLMLLIIGIVYCSPWILTALFVIQIALYLRAFLTVSAADQLNTIILAYLLISAWLPSAAVLSCCGIAIQTLFCYFANGLLKTLEPRWASGVHLKAILLTENYSRIPIARKAKDTNRQVFRLLSRIVIIWELAALAEPFLPRTLLWVFLGFGILFHLAIALVMGLNTFFWSFISTYPAILYLNWKVDQFFR